MFLTASSCCREWEERTRVINEEQGRLVVRWGDLDPFNTLQPVKGSEGGVRAIYSSLSIYLRRKDFEHGPLKDLKQFWPKVIDGYGYSVRGCAELTEYKHA